MQNWEHTQVRVAVAGHQTLVTQAPLVCLFSSQSTSKRVARHRLFSYQALVLGWTVRVPALVRSSRILILCSAAYLRQTVLLSAYETPEIRSLFNQSLQNVEGRVRTFRRWAPVQVPDGLDQACISLFRRSSISKPISMRRTLFSSIVRVPRTSWKSGFRTSPTSFFHLC